MAPNRWHTDDRIDAAIEHAHGTHPYYAAALGNLRIVPDATVPTMATSAQWVTHYNPATVAGWTVAETGAVLIHELEHLLRRHSARCGERDHQRWNTAADAEINQRLDGLPDGAVYPETLGLPRGATAETYYGAAGGPAPKPQPQPGNGDGDGDGSGDGGDDADSGDQPGDGNGSGSGDQPGDGLPSCGSAAGGPTQPQEANDARNPGRGAMDPDAVRREAAAQVLAQRPGRGTGAGDELREWAEAELGIDRARWYRALSVALGTTLSTTGAPTRWTWPGRRDIADMGGAMLPRWVSDRPKCAVVLDTSGSITPFDLDLAVAAGHYLGRIADVTFYGCDYNATKYGNTLPAAIRGGGGTDMGAGIRTAIADGAKAVVVITDCDTPWPANTGVPVIVGANAGSGYSVNYVPEWMTVIPVIEQ